MKVDWKKTSNQLPPEDENVFLFFEHGGLSAYEIGFYAGTAGWFVVCGDNSEIVDADPHSWDFLPETPTE